MYDLLITGGTLADGTGAATFTGDIGIKDGVVTAIGKLGGRAREVIDADGALVTPGFVDVHTHYDGQFLWDDKLDPSFSNGITTVVAGNCGVGFAPASEIHRDRLIELMEGVEDIPEVVLNAGLDWNWRSFPEYMDRLGERSYSMDIATQIPHAPVRVFVMGERALNHEPATPDDLIAMGKIVEEGMAAGALGVSGSRILEHLSSKGAHVPGTFAHEDELLTLARAMGKSGRGTFQIVPLGTVGARMDKELDDAKRREEHLRMEAIARAANRPITYILQQFESHPEDWRMMLDEATQSVAAGYQMKPQIAARGFGILTLLEGWHAFQSRPSYMKLAHLPLSERARVMRDPAVRAAILNEQDVPAEQAVSERVAAMVQHFRKRMHRQYLMDASLDYEPAPEQSLAAIAQATGKSMEALMYDHLVSNDGNGVAADFSLNYAHSNLDVAYDMLRHPHTITGLADGGAHMRMIADASLSSFHLTFWARDRKRGPTLPVEFLVKKHTLDTAQLYGFTDRGTLQVGQRADVNVIDFQNLKLDMPRMAYDLPGGGGRLLQGATGYLATIAGGQATRRFDQDTGARPGRLVRGGVH